MGGFAITSTHRELIVKTCHVNVWILQSLSWNPDFHFDVGLELSGLSDITEATFALYLPFKIDECTEITAKFFDKELAGLVFGEAVSVSRDDVLTTADRSLTLLRDTEHKHDSSTSTPTQSIVTVTVKAAFTDESRSYYTRLRFRTKSLGRLWQPKHSLKRTNGAIIDLRFFDYRDWLETDDTRPNWAQVVPIQRLQAFVIAPSVYQLRAKSPDLKYMRLLENHSWSKYLDRSPSFLNRSSFLIYYWDQPERPARETGRHIDNESPVRLFLDVSRDFGFLLPSNLLRFGIVMCVIMLVPWPVWRGPVHELLLDHLPRWFISIREFISKWILAVGIVTALTIAATYLRQVKQLYAWLKQRLRKVECFVIRRL